MEKTSEMRKSEEDHQKEEEKYRAKEEANQYWKKKVKQICEKEK